MAKAKTEADVATPPPKVVDQTMPAPGARWTFDGDVTEAFDDMLSRSIPRYEEMRQLCFDVGAPFVEAATKTAIVDLGCSRGEALAPFIKRFGVYNRYVGIEVSEPMLAAARERYEGLIKTGIVDVRSLDLRTGYPPVTASLTLGVLTIQFTPIEHRQRILRDVYTHTAPGGAFIMVEKVMGSTAEADKLLTDRYLDHKRASGYSADQIERKRLALEGVLVPVTARWNEDLLHASGFRTVECFWRTLNFAGWVAVKDR